MAEHPSVPSCTLTDEIHRCGRSSKFEVSLQLPEGDWLIARSYKDFERLNSAVTETIGCILPTLPPRRSILTKLSPSHRAERRARLEAFLATILSTALTTTADCPALDVFLGHAKSDADEDAKMRALRMRLLFADSQGWNPQEGEPSELLVDERKASLCESQAFNLSSAASSAMILLPRSSPCLHSSSSSSSSGSSSTTSFEWSDTDRPSSFHDQQKDNDDDLFRVLAGLPFSMASMNPAKLSFETAPSTQAISRIRHAFTEELVRDELKWKMKLREWESEDSNNKVMEESKERDAEVEKWGAAVSDTPLPEYHIQDQMQMQKWCAVPNQAASVRTSSLKEASACAGPSASSQKASQLDGSCLGGVFSLVVGRGQPKMGSSDTPDAATENFPSASFQDTRSIITTGQSEHLLHSPSEASYVESSSGELEQDDHGLRSLEASGKQTAHPTHFQISQDSSSASSSSDSASSCNLELEEVSTVDRLHAEQSTTDVQSRTFQEPEKYWECIEGKIQSALQGKLSHHVPSVGSWLIRESPHSCTSSCMQDPCALQNKALQKIRSVENRSIEQLHMMPSVGTWLMRKSPHSGTSSCRQDPFALHAEALQDMPSFGTLSIQQLHTKPSVGTWLVRELLHSGTSSPKHDPVAEALRELPLVGIRSIEQLRRMPSVGTWLVQHEIQSFSKASDEKDAVSAVMKKEDHKFQAQDSDKKGSSSTAPAFMCHQNEIQNPLLRNPTSLAMGGVDQEQPSSAGFLAAVDDPALQGSVTDGINQEEHELQKSDKDMIPIGAQEECDSSGESSTSTSSDESCDSEDNPLVEKHSEHLLEISGTASKEKERRANSDGLNIDGFWLHDGSRVALLADGQVHWLEEEMSTPLLPLSFGVWSVDMEGEEYQVKAHKQDKILQLVWSDGEIWEKELPSSVTSA